MNKYLVFLIFVPILTLCKSKKEDSDISASNQRKTQLEDTIIAYIDPDIIYKYSESEFNMIQDSFPHLPRLALGIVEEPDSSLWAHKPFLDNKYSFTSESGEDEFFTLYAFFLREYNGDTYNDVRNNLTQIYREIISLHGMINYGGTAFGHQYIRITGYVEYDVYQYPKEEQQFKDKNNFSNKKTEYIKSLEKYIDTKVETDENISPGNIKTQLERKAELYIIVNKLNNLIINSFYLEKARIFGVRFYSYSE